MRGRHRQHGQAHPAVPPQGSPGTANGTLPSVPFNPVSSLSCLSLPSDSQIAFEVILFAYCSVSMLLQHLHLFRSVFWLPHSYNSNALNWYLIEWNLLVFAGIFLGRRILWIALRFLITCLTPATWTLSFVIVGRSLASLSVLSGLFYVTYVIVQKHPVVNLLYLAYPISVYFLLFGLAGEPFLELTPTTSVGKMKVYQDKTGSYRTSYFTPGPTPNPDAIRSEVALIKSDFNMRLRQIAFNSICSAYYATFIPCAFATSALHYDFFWIVRHVVLTFLGCFTLYTLQVFPPSYVDMTHRTCNYLGHWSKIEGRVSPTFYPQWSGGQYWPKGGIVRFGKDLMRAEGGENAAEPHNTSQARFYYVFEDVSLFHRYLLIVHVLLVCFQHISLAWSSHWYMVVSETLLLFANYYALFKTARDYLVFSKVHAHEVTINKEMED